MKALKKSNGLIADIGLVYVTAIWGSTFVLVKDSLNSINAVTLVGYRFIIAAFIMLLILLAMGKKPFEKISKGVLLGGILWMMYVPQTLGLKYTKASNSAFITGLFIVFVPLIAFFFLKEKPGVNKILSVVTALIGLWILTGGMSSINIGDALTLVTAFACALHIMTAGKYVKENLNPYILNFQQFLVVGVLSFVCSAIFGFSLSYSGDKVMWAIIFLALFPTVTAFVIQLAAQKITNPIKVAIIFCLEPVFAAVFAWTLGGEHVTANGIIGGLLIVGAMILSELKIGKGPPLPQL